MEKKNMGHPGLEAAADAATRASGLALPRRAPAYWEKCERFAKARADARQALVGPDLMTARSVWLPRLAGSFVRLSDEVEGYQTRAEAIAAAQRFRAACREHLAEKAREAGQ